MTDSPSEGASAARLAAVRGTIAQACAEAGRDAAAVTLIAVSKTFGADAIVPVIAAGQRVFGENRVQEAKAKWPELKPTPATRILLVPFAWGWRATASPLSLLPANAVAVWPPLPKEVSREPSVL